MNRKYSIGTHSVVVNSVKKRVVAELNWFDFLHWSYSSLFSSMDSSEQLLSCKWDNLSFIYFLLISFFYNLILSFLRMKNGRILKVSTSHSFPSLLLVSQVSIKKCEELMNQEIVLKKIS